VAEEMKKNPLPKTSAKDEALETIERRNTDGNGSIKNPMRIASEKDGEKADSFDLNDVAKNGKTETLDVNTVETTQRDLVPEKLKSIVNVGSVEKRDDDPVLVVRVNGKNIVVDGNHRCASALLLGQKTISAKVVEARRAVTIHPLEAAAGPLPGQIERVIVSLQNDGRLPIRIPPETMRHVAESLARYFQTASADKIEQFAEAAKAAVEAELKTVNVQTHDTMKADTTGVNVGATPATSRSVLTSFIESATGENIGGLMNMDFFNRIMREVTQGAGNFVAQNFDQTRLDEFPALELHRVYDREVPRGFKVGKGGAIIPDPDNDWPSRWEAAGGELVDGRMVALKSDPIWQALGDGEGGYEDTLGNPFAPFAFNSGYDTDEVSREDAVALGLMNDEDEAKPAEFDFTKLLNIEAASAASAGPLVLNANWPVESPANDRRRARLGLQAAAGDVPLVVKCFITDADGRLLVLQADGYGRMDLPGGHLRAGETVEAGLRREVLEETGMTLNSVKELGTVLVPWNGQQPIVFFSAKADTDAPMALSDEHVDWFWLNRHEVALRNFSALTKVVNNFTDGKDLNEA
jgi:8-oxo-dGTP pyrophosphatase MutT (NUDIX family)